MPVPLSPTIPKSIGAGSLVFHFAVAAGFDSLTDIIKGFKRGAGAAGLNIFRADENKESLYIIFNPVLPLKTFFPIITGVILLLYARPK